MTRTPSLSQAAALGLLLCGAGLSSAAYLPAQMMWNGRADVGPDQITVILNVCSTCSQDQQGRTQGDAYRQQCEQYCTNAGFIVTPNHGAAPEIEVMEWPQSTAASRNFVFPKYSTRMATDGDSELRMAQPSAAPAPMPIALPPWTDEDNYMDAGEGYTDVGAEGIPFGTDGFPNLVGPTFPAGPMGPKGPPQGVPPMTPPAGVPSSDSGYTPGTGDCTPPHGDDDSDGIVNAMDEDCAGSDIGGIHPAPTIETITIGGGEPPSAEVCTNGMDDDGDALVDGFDPDCASDDFDVPVPPSPDELLDQGGLPWENWDWMKDIGTWLGF